MICVFTKSKVIKWFYKFLFYFIAIRVFIMLTMKLPNYKSVSSPSKLFCKQS